MTKFQNVITQLNPLNPLPQVSLLMPFYQAGAYIREALLSLMEQSMSDWELIAIDDGSSDEGRFVVEELAADDPRIRLYINPEKGILPALQLGLKKARGTFIGRFDADDLLPPDRLKLMLDLLQGSASKTIVTGLVQYFSDNPISPGYVRYQDWINELNFRGQTWKDIYRECVIASPNWLMRRAELEAINGFNDLEYPEDYDWCFRCYQNQFEVQSLSSTTLLWREHPNRTSRHSDHYQQQAFFNLKIKRFLELESFGDLILWGTGRKARLSAAILRERQIRFRWMDLEPQRFPKGIQGVGIEDYRKLKAQPGLKLLIGVYPNPAQRQDLEAFLVSRHLELGKDYWYL